ncbi:maleylacetoacetate isomerase [Thaumasiovibrio sp. DFM-14]|uniref:maleylacetoacetate isomerase n=1 Tax=Thaumasiovibrio sp. DFM-14 TaxID=3384792 RepID=UPI0039A09CB6
MILYDYPRSSAAFRVRIALNLKNINYDRVVVSLLEQEQHATDFALLNPNASVPVLLTDEGAISQSMAIIEYLEDISPSPSLLPFHRLDKARCRSIAQLISTDIHPLNNLRVLNYLSNTLQISDEHKMTWYHHWIARGFAAIDKMIHSNQTPYCCANTPTVADVCLIPQLYNARRFQLDLTPYPKLLDIESACLALPAFSDAHPDNLME